MLNQQLRGFDVFGVVDLEETFLLLVLLVEKLESPPPCGKLVDTGVRPPRSKRQREASPRTCSTRMLRCVPGVSQDTASKLADRFRSLPALQRALASEAPLPRMQLDHGERVKYG